MMRCQEKTTEARKQLPQQYINYTTDKLIAEKYIHSIIKQTVSITIAYQQFYSKVHVFPVVLMSTLQIISFIWRMVGTSIIISCYFRTCTQSNFKFLGLIFLQFVGDVSEKSRSCNNIKSYNKDTCWFVTSKMGFTHVSEWFENMGLPEILSQVKYPQDSQMLWERSAGFSHNINHKRKLSHLRKSQMTQVKQRMEMGL